MSTPMAKHYVYGSGMVGCLFDSGPHCATDLEEAIDGILFVFEDSVSEAEAVRMRVAFRSGATSWYFDNPSEAGAQYAEITEANGPCPETDE